MKSDTARNTPSWLLPMLLQALGGTFEIGIKLSELPTFRAKHPAANGVVTLKTIAGTEVNGDTLHVNFLDVEDTTGRHELTPDAQGYRVTNYYAFGQPGIGDQRGQIIEIIGINRADAFVPDPEIALVADFLRNSATPVVGMGNQVNIDARFVGDTAATILRLQDGTIRQLDNLVVLGYSPEQGMVIARDREGVLYIQAADKLWTNPTMFDQSKYWAKIGGIQDDQKVFRMGRIIQRSATELVATISLTDGTSAEPKHGVMVLNTATKMVQIVVDRTGEVTEFLMTATDGNGFMAYVPGSLTRLKAEQVPGVYQPYADAAQG